MSTASEVQTQITIRARAAALAWLNVFLASGQDEERPALFRTLSIEFFRRGVQFVGCDGTALFRSWVPENLGDKPAPWPLPGERPGRTVVIMDTDGFGSSYMRTLLKVTGEEEHELEELTMSLLPSDEGATLNLGTEFMSERLALRACGQRTDLVLFEGDYPNWRGLNYGLDKIEQVDTMTLAPRLFAMVGKLKGVNAVDMEFHGEARSIGFRARGDTEVRGLLMPMRRMAAKPSEAEKQSAGAAA